MTSSSFQHSVRGRSLNVCSVPLITLCWMHMVSLQKAYGRHSQLCTGSNVAPPDVHLLALNHITQSLLLCLLFHYSEHISDLSLMLASMLSISLLWKHQSIKQPPVQNKPVNGPWMPDSLGKQQAVCYFQGQMSWASDIWASALFNTG